MSIKRIILLCMIMVMSADPARGAEQIKIAGSGGMIPLVTELAKGFMAKRTDVVILVYQQSIQSGGGIKGAASGELGIGMANRPLKDDEKSLGVEVVDIAQAAVVIGTNKSIALDTISSEDLCRIYAGAVTTWDELHGGSGTIVALTKPETDATKELIRKNIPCYKNLKESEKIISIKSSMDMTDTLAKAKAIGLTDSVSVESSQGAIKAVKLDGIAPVPENIRSGKYKLVQTFRLVTKGIPSGAINDFINFVKGTEGRKIIEAKKAIAAK